jgi:tetratricopeptide (TPR) repeat protein
MTTDPDFREQLRYADELARTRRHGEAIALYERVATAYVERGSHLRTAALAKTIVSIADRFSLSDRALPALRLLASAYRELGLLDEAASAEKRCRELDPRS